MKTNRREFIICVAAAAVVVPSIAKAMPDEGIALRNWASMIEDYLRERRIDITPMYFAKEGCRIGEFGMTYQKHLDVMSSPPSYPFAPSLAENHIQMLAKSILRQARWFRRSRMQFSNLWMPSAGPEVIDTAQYQSKRVHMRELTTYDIMSDSMMKRLDVLYRFV